MRAVRKPGQPRSTENLNKFSIKTYALTLRICSGTSCFCLFFFFSLSFVFVCWVLISMRVILSTESVDELTRPERVRCQGRNALFFVCLQSKCKLHAHTQMHNCVVFSVLCIELRISLTCEARARRRERYGRSAKLEYILAKKKSEDRKSETN